MAAVYCGTFFVTSVEFNLLFASIAGRRRLVGADIANEVRVRVRRAYLLGPLVYAVSVLAALWNAAAGLAICTSLWLVWTRLCYRESRQA